MMNSCPDRIVCVPACLLCPALMAGGKGKESWQKDILHWLTENDYSILSLPCPEASFAHPQTGIGRKPHGVQFYEALSGFREHCAVLSEQVANQIAELAAHGCAVHAILGIEHSPTCAVNYMYTRRGTVKRPGLFMENLSECLNKKGLQIPILGINRQYPKKVIEMMTQVG